MPDAKSSQSAWTRSGWDAVDSTPAFTRGVFTAWHDTPAYTRGATSITTSQTAYLYGGVSVKSNVPAFLAVTGGLVRGSIHAYLTAEVRSSIHAYIGDAALAPDYGAPVMAEYDFIELKTSDGGATLSKKFAVVAAGYDDGTPDKAETLERTVGGGLNRNLGAIYKSWSPMIHVRHTEDREGYGTLADLEYFYNLNNPNGTPSDKITFIDHHGTSRTVLISGQLKKAILGFKIEGLNAWYVVAIRMLEVQ